MNALILILLFILIVATWLDLVRHRIPNVITFVAMAVGLCSQGWAFGAEGVLVGLGGLMAGLVVLLPLYIGGGMGAGDVKLMAAVGTFLGPLNALVAGALTLLAGGVLAIGVLLMRKCAMPLLRRYGSMLQCLLTTGRVGYVSPQAGEAAAIRFPFAVAIAVGALTTLLLNA